MSNQTTKKNIHAGHRERVRENVLKNGFELYNLINEKLYTVTSLSKMNSYRGIGIGQFLIARIFQYPIDRQNYNW